jgi:DNA-directed RNA polymerase I and III subunit RPAC1
MEIDVTSINDSTLEFNLIGVDVSIANALRRLMIAEVPTMAIEHVFIINNTSVIQDELLASRLGLLPVYANPSVFDYQSNNESPNEKNTIVFRLEISCKKIRDSIIGQNVSSGSLEWLPEGSSIPEETNCWFSKRQDGIDSNIRLVYSDILLAVLAPGQEIILEAHCTKGKGRDHSKWSPVATSWYYLASQPMILKKIDGFLAEELATELPGLIKLIGKKPNRLALVEKVRSHETMIAKFRRLSCEDKWAQYLQLRKVKNQFVFKIETLGAINTWDIFDQAINLLKRKIEKVSIHI